MVVRPIQELCQLRWARWVFLSFYRSARNSNTLASIIEFWYFHLDQHQDAMQKNVQGINIAVCGIALVSSDVRRCHFISS